MGIESFEQKMLSDREKYRNLNFGEVISLILEDRENFPNICNTPCLTAIVQSMKEHWVIASAPLYDTHKYALERGLYDTIDYLESTFTLHHFVGIQPSAFTNIIGYNLKRAKSGNIETEKILSEAICLDKKIVYNHSFQLSDFRMTGDVANAKRFIAYQSKLLSYNIITHFQKEIMEILLTTNNKRNFDPVYYNDSLNYSKFQPKHLIMFLIRTAILGTPRPSVHDENQNISKAKIIVSTSILSELIKMKVIGCDKIYNGEQPGVIPLVGTMPKFTNINADTELDVFWNSELNHNEALIVFHGGDADSGIVVAPNFTQCGTLEESAMTLCANYRFRVRYGYETFNSSDGASSLDDNTIHITFNDNMPNNNIDDLRDIIFDRMADPDYIIKQLEDNSE